MQTVSNHSRKINKALAISAIGNCPLSAQAMLGSIPASAIAAVTAHQLAEMIDAAWRLAQASKAIAITDAVDEGGVWDDSRQAFRRLN